MQGGLAPAWVLAKVVRPDEVPEDFVIDYFTTWALWSEQAELQVQNMKDQPAGQYAHLVVADKFLGGDDDD